MKHRFHVHRDTKNAQAATLDTFNYTNYSQTASTLVMFLIFFSR